MKAQLLIILAVSLLLAAGDADDVLEQENKKLQGEWAAQSMQAGDQTTPAEALKNLRLLIEGDKWTVSAGDGKRQYTWKVDPTKDPKHLDFTLMRDGKEVVMRCLYELKDNHLSVCSPIKNVGERPTKIAAADGIGVMIWKRAKK